MGADLEVPEAFMDLYSIIEVLVEIEDYLRLRSNHSPLEDDLEEQADKLRDIIERIGEEYE